MTPVILGPMKTAVSIPDKLFKEADRVARKKQISRSRLYATALEAYLRKLSDDEITAQYDRVYCKEPAVIDPGLMAAQLVVINREPW
jgi:hypothetical protein